MVTTNKARQGDSKVVNNSKSKRHFVGAGQRDIVLDKQNNVFPRRLALNTVVNGAGRAGKCPFCMAKMFSARPSPTIPDFGIALA